MSMSCLVGVARGFDSQGDVRPDVAFFKFGKEPLACSRVADVGDGEFEIVVRD